MAKNQKLGMQLGSDTAAWRGSRIPSLQALGIHKPSAKSHELYLGKGLGLSAMDQESWILGTHRRASRIHMTQRRSRYEPRRRREATDRPTEHTVHAG